MLAFQVIFIWFCVDWTGISYAGYQYPPWAEFLGWMLCIVSILCVPGYAIYRYKKLPEGGTFKEVTTSHLLTIFKDVYGSVLTTLWKGIQDSLGFWIPPRGFRIPLVDSGFQSLVGFRIPKSRIRIRIPLHRAHNCSRQVKKNVHTSFV